MVNDIKVREKFGDCIDMVSFDEEFKQNIKNVMQIFGQAAFNGKVEFLEKKAPNERD